MVRSYCKKSKQLDRDHTDLSEPVGEIQDVFGLTGLDLMKGAFKEGDTKISEPFLYIPRCSWLQPCTNILC